MKIPKLVHRIWLDDPLPERFAFYGQLWKDLHPDWVLADWRRSDELPPLINGWIFERAQEITPDWKRFQADLLRLELLYLFGGVYADCDVKPLRSIGTMLRGSTCVLAPSPQTDKNGKHPLTQAVMASTAKHPFIKACIDSVPAAVKNYRGKHIAQMVGPWLITRAYEKYQPERGAWVTVADSCWLYPEDEDDPRGYTWHAWNNARRKKGKGLG